jgi:hypothetical protein
MSYLAAFLLLHMPCDEAFISLGNLLALRYFPDFLSVSGPRPHAAVKVRAAIVTHLSRRRSRF